eukprot:6047703-Prymnesium_polylepis.1
MPYTDCTRTPANARLTTQPVVPSLIYRDKTPDQIGQHVFVLPRSPVAEDFPFVCSAGLLGGASISHQTSPFYAGLCPQGFTCSAGTSIPQRCKQGAFCPTGSSTWQDCPVGRYSHATGLWKAEQFPACPAGSSCLPGSTTPVQCGVGTIAPTHDSSLDCVRCVCQGSIKTLSAQLRVGAASAAHSALLAQQHRLLAKPEPFLTPRLFSLQTGADFVPLAMLVVSGHRRRNRVLRGDSAPLQG